MGGVNLPLELRSTADAKKKNVQRHNEDDERNNEDDDANEIVEGGGGGGCELGFIDQTINTKSSDFLSISH